MVREQSNTCYILAGIDRFTDDHGFIVGVQYLFLRGRGTNLWMQFSQEALFLLETSAFGESVLIVKQPCRFQKLAWFQKLQKIYVVCHPFCNCPYICLYKTQFALYILIGNFLMDHLVILYTCFCLLLLPEQMWGVHADKWQLFLTSIMYALGTRTC